MSALVLTVVPLGGNLDAALAALPASAGVAQILGADDASLVIARAANLRRWAASQLGRGKPRPPGVRPALDLTPVARAIAYTPARSAFGQRLAFERLMARHVAPAKRRDLKTPAYLHLDPGERFPRLAVRTRADATSVLFGPFRDAAAAGRARDALHKRFRLRPCDFTFEPHPELPLGVACLYAQVHSCAAPCLVRVSEDAYRGIAREAARLLAEPEARAGDEAAVLPAWVRPARARSLVVEAAKGRIELYPVRDGAVLDDAVQTGALETLEDAVARLFWPEAEQPHRDTAWLNAWRHAPKRSGRELPVGEGEPMEDLATRIRAALDPHQ